MDDDMQAMEVRDREIERRLDAYARARLSPDPQAIARTRARVMREARLQFEAARIAAHIAPAVILAPRRSPARRLAMPFLAASVWLGIAVGSISAAQPGGPLYTTRMWVEDVTLPAAIAPRTTAELGRLDARLAEAMTGAARGDAGAVAAAMDAYALIADEAVTVAAGDDALEAVVAAALDKHGVVLAAVAARLAGKGNDQAAAAVGDSIQRAIVHNQAVVHTLEAAGAGNGTNGTSDPGGPVSNPGGPVSNPGGNDGVNGGPATAAPTGSPDGAAGGGSGADGGSGAGGDGKPEKTPKPTPEPTSPQGTPAHTPRGQDR
jgi:hypothetical protein